MLNFGEGKDFFYLSIYWKIWENETISSNQGLAPTRSVEVSLRRLLTLFVGEPCLHRTHKGSRVQRWNGTEVSLQPALYDLRLQSRPEAFPWRYMCYRGQPITNGLGVEETTPKNGPNSVTLLENSHVKTPKTGALEDDFSFHFGVIFKFQPSPLVFRGLGWGIFIELRGHTNMAYKSQKWVSIGLT